MRSGYKIGSMPKDKDWVVPATIVLVILGLLWLFGTDKGKSFMGMKRQSNPSNPAAASTSPDQSTSATIITQVKKNTEGTLSLVGTNSVTGQIVSSRVLGFDEAVKLVGNYNKVCQMAQYEQCKSIRR